MSSSSTIPSSYVKTKIDFSFYQESKKFLETIDPEELSNTQLQEFEKKVRSWYPIYRELGIEEYNQSSIIWRIWTYVPLVFESYTALGKAVASSDMKKLKEFLKKNIPKKIQDLEKMILAEEQFKKRLEFAQSFNTNEVKLPNGCVCKIRKRDFEKFKAMQLLFQGRID